MILWIHHLEADNWVWTKSRRRGRSCFLHQADHSGSLEIRPPLKVVLVVSAHVTISLYPVTSGIWHFISILFLLPLEDWLIWTCLGLQGSEMTKISSGQSEKYNGLLRLPTVRQLVFKKIFWVWYQVPTPNEASQESGPPYAVVAQFPNDPLG